MRRLIMEYIKSENGMTTVLIVATLAMVCVVAAAFQNAFNNISVVLP
jgi:succinate dehydrogenase hydrophobic anchor subunit